MTYTKKKSYELLFSKKLITIQYIQKTTILFPSTLYVGLGKGFYDC